MDTVQLRIIVVGPVPGVAVQLQQGRSELVPPTQATAEQLVFEFPLRIGRPQADGAPTFLGAFAQGPPGARFIYVNAGVRAGQTDSCWDRRAKVPLRGITKQQLETIREDPTYLLEATIAGTAGDGGPACATVPLLRSGWRVSPAGESSGS